MKKLLAILLCIATLFCFVACSEEDDDDDRKSSKRPGIEQEKEDDDIVLPAPKPAEPTEEDLENLRQYYYLCYQCQDISNISQEQKENLYRQLVEAASLDYWLSTEYATELFVQEFNDPDLVTDRQTLLNKFVILDNVLLHYRRASHTDNLGNVNTNDHGDTFWEYDENGNVCRLQNAKYYLGDFCAYAYDNYFTTEYDTDGKILNQRYYLIDGTVFVMVIYNYDENDRLISEEHRQNTTSRFVYYSYDENGRLAQISWENLLNYTLDYAYDDQGRLIQETFTEWVRGGFLSSDERYPSSQNIREYRYDAKGVRCDGSFSEIEYYNHGESIGTLISGTLSFEYDNEGRLMTETRTYNPKRLNIGSSIEETVPHTVNSETYEYTYGTYYICAE